MLEPAGRRVRLTEQAEILVAHTEAVLERLERAEAEIATSLSDLTGTLRVASFQTAALALVPTALGLLRDLHPQLRVHVTHMEPERALPALLARDFDLVLAEEYPGNPNPRSARAPHLHRGTPRPQPASRCPRLPRRPPARGHPPARPHRSPRTPAGEVTPPPRPRAPGRTTRAVPGWG